MKNLIFNPIGLFCTWTMACVFFWFIIQIISDDFHPSSQTQFVLRTYLFISLVCGIFLISLLNMFLFKEWVRRFWFFNGFLTLVTGGTILFFIIKISTI
ncbi:hypothetical protein D0X99_15145 [Algoriphagus lacus]|uniref:Uncharacterized protein n=1 Tax=Algoriphagus lacus TaxID=2056311 RepID=A0A418PNI7_9BACT|nr:hypothetical protein D0X99_15145 [Algoriphagus lacus]